MATEGTAVIYDQPDTTKARDIVAAATNEIHILNWSGFRQADQTFKKLGWKLIIGNFAGTRRERLAGHV